MKRADLFFLMNLGFVVLNAAIGKPLNLLVAGFILGLTVSQLFYTKLMDKFFKDLEAKRD